MTETVLLMLVVGAFLAFVNLIAFLTRNSKRTAERERFERAIRERENRTATPVPATAAPAPSVVPVPSPFGPVAFSPPVPVVPARPLPRPKALRAWTPPQAEQGAPQLNRYIAWPNTKLTTPVAERTPADNDYVWD